MNQRSGLALHWKILIGMAAGILLGILAVWLDSEPNGFWSTLVVNWIKPFGTIFINLLKLIAIPLIVASLIKGVSNLNNISSLSAMGGRTVVLYLFTTVVSVTLGLLMVNLVKPGNSFTKETRELLTSEFSEDAQRRIQVAENQKSQGPLQALIDVVPDNIVGAATANGNMLKVIFFVLFFGVALLLVKPEQAKPVKDFFNSLNEVVLKMIDLIMLMAPFGVSALLAAQIVTTPSLDVLYGLFQYSLCVVCGLGLMVFLVYPSLVVLFAGRSYTEFFRGISPAQLLAFSTSSSAATLPVTMECVEDHLGVKKEVSSFVLPIGATVNMDGTSLYQAVAAVFIAQALGTELALSDQLVIVLTATLASIGSAAVPGAGIVMLVIVLGSIGVPEKGIALIFAVDRILDMCRTTVNVTGDATVALLINKNQERKKHSQPREGDPA
ncbi:MAG: dicarboxylate/amino acid:cation symporter [Planctomycetota bacterium]|nr:dicarboxylate/amino acid:cation symporter [Planctomycetota bacterium]